MTHCFLRFELDCASRVLLGNPFPLTLWLLGLLSGVLVYSSPGSLPTRAGPVLLPSPAARTGVGVSLGLCPAYYCLLVSNDLVPQSPGLCLQGKPQCRPEPQAKFFELVKGLILVQRSWGGGDVELPEATGPPSTSCISSLQLPLCRSALASHPS